jgi:hypothetical protein
MYFDYNVPASLCFERIIHDDTQHVRALHYLPPQPLTQSDMAFWKLYASEWVSKHKEIRDRDMAQLQASWARNNLEAKVHMAHMIWKGHLAHECIPTLEQFNREMRHFFIIRGRSEQN